MRKYRINKSSSNPRFAKFINGLYFVFGWNMLGVLAYYMIRPRMREKYPEWDSMTWSQRYFSMTHPPESQVVIVKGVGFQKLSTSTMTVDEYTTYEKNRTENDSIPEVPRKDQSS